MFRRAAKTLSCLSLGALALAAPAALTGCTPVTVYQGYQAVDEKPSEAKVGVDDRASIRRRFGSPTAVSSFEDNIWYYIAQTADQFGAYRPRVRSRDIVAITFDKTSQQVTSVDAFTLADGRVVAFNGRETPTVGRELSVLEQLLGTVGTGMSNQMRDLDPGQRGPQR